MDKAPAEISTLDLMVPVIFDALRAMAHRQLAREHGPITLQTTELVHEAYLRLAHDARATRLGRAYFCAAAARAMRQVLVFSSTCSAAALPSPTPANSSANRFSRPALSSGTSLSSSPGWPGATLTEFW